jgi:molecular chaperone GrpE
MTDNRTDAPADAEALRQETADAAPEVAEHDAAAARIAELENQLADAKQQTLYAQADIQNVRRRAEKDVADAREDEKMKGLVTGLEATGREFDSVLARNGITRIQAMGVTLDPNKHQAMMEVPSDAEPGTVVTEMQAGYMIKDRLLRPALVGVAKKPD